MLFNKLQEFANRLDGLLMRLAGSRTHFVEKICIVNFHIVKAALANTKR